MHITLTPDVIKKALLKLKPGKASGPDGVAPRLLKLAEKYLSHLYFQYLHQARQPIPFL